MKERRNFLLWVGIPSINSGFGVPSCGASLRRRFFPLEKGPPRPFSSEKT